MSTTSRVIITIIIIILLGVIGYVYVLPSVERNSQDEMNATSARQMESTVSSTSSVDQDVTSIDAQLKGLDSDSATVDQSMNDKPVSQE